MKDKKGPLTIGKAARAANVNVETIRFYERRGLIAQPPKPKAGGFREYLPDTVQRIRFIREAQEIGFSLGEISDLLSLRADPDADCADVRSRAIQKREEVQARLDRLSHMSDALDELIANCPGGGNVKACTILEAMEKGTREPVGKSPDKPKPTKENAEMMKTTILNVDGMHCDGCARTIEALLSRVPGVRKAEASYDERNARVLHDREQAPVASLVAAVAKGGFQVTPAD